MGTIKKIDHARNFLINQIDIFQCPICQNSVTLNNYSLQCSENHNFDLARKGYLNLVVSNAAPSYSQSLFAARQRVYNAGLYDPLLKKLNEIIAQSVLPAYQPITILDAGCGEGSLLTKLVQANRKANPLLGIGIDIAKAGINLACSNPINSLELFWCVADLAQLPVKNQCVDLVLNILSPANYGEFKRVIKKQGLIIKVVPGANYLKEIRKLINKDEKQNYSNQEIIDHFNANLKLVATHQLHYQFSIVPDLPSDLVTMTPLTWGHKIDPYLTKLDQITIDLQILVGTNPNTD